VAAERSWDSAGTFSTPTRYCLCEEVGLNVGIASPAIGVVVESDAALMFRVKEGDKDAFGDLIDRHKHGVVNYLTRLTRDRDRAEELAQEAFLRLYQKSSYYQEQGQLLSYLLRIAVNLLRSEQRRAQRWRVLSGQVKGEMRPPPPTPHRLAMSNEATREVDWALSQLPLRYRAPLVLREIEGLSYREIATALGCREGTIKSRISRGREKLKTLLAPYWLGDAR